MKEEKTHHSFLIIKWSLFVKPWVPLTKSYFVPSLVEIGPVVLEKIFKFCQCIFAILKLSPLRKRHVLSCEKKTWIAITQGCFMPSLVKIGPIVLEKKMKMWKLLTDRWNDRQTNEQNTTGNQKSSLELSVQVN